MLFFNCSKYNCNILTGVTNFAVPLISLDFFFQSQCAYLGTPFIHVNPNQELLLLSVYRRTLIDFFMSGQNPRIKSVHEIKAHLLYFYRKKYSEGMHV